jgi:metal-responsive CopG/Arc/MetJ family transcriptional regulator
MKTAISVPDDVFRTAESFARRQQVSRSALFTRAVEEFLAHHRHEGVTERLNHVYAREESHLDPVLSRLQSVAISREKW